MKIGNRPCRRASTIAASIFLITFSTHSHAQAPDAKGVAKEPPTVETQGNGQAQRGQNYTVESPLPVRIVEDPVEAERARDRDQKSQKHDADDLEAQSKAASAAERSAAASEGQRTAADLQTVFAVVGTIALLITLGLTRKSVSISEQALRGLERPYMFIELGISHGIRKPEEGQPRIEYKLVNYGKTPAVLRMVAVGLQDNPTFPLTSPLAVADIKYSVVKAGGETLRAWAEMAGDPHDGQGFKGASAADLILYAIIEYAAESPRTAPHTRW